MLANQKPMNAATLRRYYQHLLQINKETFAGGEYDIAFHALTTALHCAQRLKDIDFLVEVEQLANEQLAAIDTEHPEYEHSTQSASMRNHVSVYQTLAHQAKARVAIIQNTAKPFPHLHNRGNRAPTEEGIMSFYLASTAAMGLLRFSNPRLMATEASNTIPTIELMSSGAISHIAATNSTACATREVVQRVQAVQAVQNVWNAWNDWTRIPQ